MPEIKVKLKSGKVIVLFLPKEISPTIRKIITETLSASTHNEYAEEIIYEFENLLTGAEVLMEHLKTDKAYSKKIESILRDLMAIYLGRGLIVGEKTHEKPEVIMKMIKEPYPNFQKKLSGLPKKKRWMAEYIIHSFILGKQCYETGLALSALLSMDKVKEYAKKLETEVEQYIG